MFLGHSIISHSLGKIIILKSFGIDKALFKIMKLDIFVNFHNVWAILQFYKVLGSNYKFKKYFIVAVTVASGLPDMIKRQTEYWAVSVWSINGLPDFISGKPDIPKFKFLL